MNVILNYFVAHQGQLSFDFLKNIFYQMHIRLILVESSLFEFGLDFWLTYNNRTFYSFSSGFLKFQLQKSMTVTQGSPCCNYYYRL